MDIVPMMTMMAMTSTMGWWCIFIDMRNDGDDLIHTRDLKTLCKSTYYWLKEGPMAWVTSLADCLTIRLPGYIRLHGNAFWSERNDTWRCSLFDANVSRLRHILQMRCTGCPTLTPGDDCSWHRRELWLFLGRGTAQSAIMLSSLLQRKSVTLPADVTSAPSLPYF